MAKSPRGGLFVVPATDGSLAIDCEETFARLADWPNAGPRLRTPRALGRQFFAGAQAVELDSQGRIRTAAELAQMGALRRRGDVNRRAGPSLSCGNVVAGRPIWRRSNRGRTRLPKTRLRPRKVDIQQFACLARCAETDAGEPVATRGKRKTSSKLSSGSSPSRGLRFSDQSAATD